MAILSDGDTTGNSFYFRSVEWAKRKFYFKRNVFVDPRILHTAPMRGKLSFNHSLNEDVHAC